MKVLTIKEPYATLIKSGVKKIETRSWKTNYRGTIYIHAGISKITNKIKNNKELICLVDELNYGQIICSCELVDCILMTKEFIEKVKENHNEYITGLYEEGRYAWILDDIKIIKPIKAKGHLGIWNLK